MRRASLAPIQLGNLGLWQLDLAASVAFPPLIADPSRRADLTLQIPSTPTLSGLSLHFQAIDAEVSTSVFLHATNRFTTTIQ